MPIKKFTTLKDIWEVIAVSKSDAEVFQKLKNLEPSRVIVRNAVEQLTASGRECPALHRYASLQGWDSLRKVNGAAPPKAGDKRTYTVMQVKNSTPFVRVPVNNLGLKKGQHAIVYFETGRTVIESAGD